MSEPRIDRELTGYLRAHGGEYPGKVVVWGPKGQIIYEPRGGNDGADRRDARERAH